MADTGVPKIGEVIHADDLEEAVNKISSLAVNGVRSYSYNTYAGSSINIFNSVNSMDVGEDENLVEKKAVADALDNVLKNDTELLSAQLTSGTKTISNILNYKLIGIYVFNGSGQYLGGAVCATPWHLVNLCNNSSHRLVVSTDTLYYAIYFPSATSVAVYNYYVGTGNTPTIKIVGIW